jgi:LPXTG-motif cell wall-anchored protein
LDEDGEGTTDDGVSAEADEGGASAETPGASAQSGDPDAFSPEGSVRGDVVDEVPTEGPLPNTGGSPAWIYGMVGAGLLVLGAALLRRFGR